MSTTLRKVCHCENCDNEAEMVITCSLPEESEKKENESGDKKGADTEHKKVKGSAVCSHCGNEADMWIDM